MKKESKDKQLLRELSKGDIFAFNEIYKKYSKFIYSYSLKYLKSKEDADGVVQEIFLNLWRKRADLKLQYNIDSYLFTITLNAIRKKWRNLATEKKHLEIYARNISIQDDCTNTDIVNNDLLELAGKTIDKLPPRQKTIYQLSKKEGISNEEISGKLKISKKTVENHLNRAKTSIRNAIKD